MSAVDDLIAFLRAQLDEDERVALAASDWPWEATISQSGEQGDVQGVTSAFEDYCCSAEDATHIARWDPARVLAEVEAKRRILDAGTPRREREETGEYLHFGNWSSCSDDCASTVWWEILKLLAQPYAGREAWREEWYA